MPWTGTSPNQTVQRTDGTRTGDDTWQQASAASVKILSSAHDTHDEDVAQMVDDCLKKDGGNTATANIPMGGFGFTACSSVANTGGVDVQGTNTNDSASSGYYGEYTSAVTSVAVSLTTVTPADAVSISLTAGDWDVWGNCLFDPDASTTVAYLRAWINTTSATAPTGISAAAGADTLIQTTFTTGQDQIISAGRRRISIASTTTVYLGVTASFAVSTMTAFAFIAARRVR